MIKDVYINSREIMNVFLKNLLSDKLIVEIKMESQCTLSNRRQKNGEKNTKEQMKQIEIN